MTTKKRKAKNVKPKKKAMRIPKWLADGSVSFDAGKITIRKSK